MAYNKHNFQVGQIFTAAQANSIDNGIVANEEKIAQVEAMFAGKLNKNQGSQNAGNVLTVGTNGEVVANQKMPEFDMSSIDIVVSEPSDGYVVVSFVK